MQLSFFIILLIEMFSSSTMLGQSSGMTFQQGFQPQVFNDQTWMLTKFRSMSGSPKLNIDGNVRAVFSMHRRQLAVWSDNTMLICIDLHHAKTTVPTKDVYAIVKENNVSLCRLKFRSIPERISFGAALSDLVHVTNDKCSSQDVSSQGWQSNNVGASSSQTEKVSSQGRSDAGVTQMVGGFNWNGNAPLNHFNPPYTPPQTVIGTSSSSQSWKMTPPSSQSTSQQYKSQMPKQEASSYPTLELNMERGGWSTPVKRPHENTREPALKKKKEEYVNSTSWETCSSFSSTYSDSDSLNDSFSSCSSQKSELSSQPSQQMIFPRKSLYRDVCTETSVESVEMATQTDAYPEEHEISTLLKRLLDHPQFVSFTNLISSQIDGDEELLAMVDKNFAIEGEEDEDADKTQPLEEDEKEKEKADESGNESDHSDIIEL